MSKRLMKKLQVALSTGSLVPIVGDAIRLSHIFDLNMDEKLGVVDRGIESEKHPNKLTIMEQLSCWWAREIEYPLLDEHRISRVAQFYRVELDNAVDAKQEYIDFLKSKLLELVGEMAKSNKDARLCKTVERLERELGLSFADVVQKLELPIFPNGKEDPLRTLARLPIKVYVTTGYYDFIEKALMAEDKQPVSEMSYWYTDSQDPIASRSEDLGERRPPTVDEPLVFHLFGMEQHPQSMVLTEEDYLRFLWKLGKDRQNPGYSGERVIPVHVEQILAEKTLLLLGYRLGDWDFRLLFHSLLAPVHGGRPRNRPFSVAVHIDPQHQPLVKENSGDEAREYLKQYFKLGGFAPSFQKSDDFIKDLWQARPGTKTADTTAEGSDD